MTLAAFVGWTICALLQDAPAQDPPPSPLAQAIQATRAEPGFRFTFQRDQTQSPHDPTWQQGEGTYRNDGTFLLMYRASGEVSNLILRHEEHGVYYEDLAGEWWDVRDLDDELGRGFDNPDRLLDLVFRRAGQAQPVMAWTCPNCPTPPGRLPPTARADMWRLELVGEQVREILEDLGYEPTQIVWNTARACVTMGLDDAGRVAEVWMTGFLEFTPGADVDQAGAGVRIQLTYDGAELPAQVRFRGLPVSVADGLDALQALSAPEP